ncbi:hypothetical protein BGI05_08360 [Snodgrassella alvi]|uniref:polymer-forming cytoskeletal protein n=1 Tax=Snodgrassella alvi TaxID=1196083 RepID=UPI000A0191E6|nr:polymer-forming cytoskeletal protein [Snodgrassella alvi]ORF01474.1 hypothetical protein BGH97_07025 [Snodgrassella alvi]ORF08764.1 hypothetical protein BGH99_04755 [Snodgrassella alvi]ORF12856.1 hypothetical protein BGI00_04975 [Snodgrassella alvi]ORF13401.1 hypothetical protein BGI02_07320 [Snodgrassella alvi]ORF19349.1 hypothetical protein BGI05_08360 [Snodgrassella alvi]
MKAKEEEFIVTEKWLAENGARKDELQAFEQHFPNGGEALEVLKRCEELNYIDFGEWLVDCLPPTYPPLVLNTSIGSLFYPNDVHIKGDMSTQGRIYIKGSLKVDGKLTVNKYGNVNTHINDINANVIDISENAFIFSDIKTNSLIMSGRTDLYGCVVANSISLHDSAQILGDAKAKVINSKNSRIRGSVDADEIINDGGLIDGNVNTFTIENINGGEVAGKITYKRSDEHK